MMRWIARFTLAVLTGVLFSPAPTEARAVHYFDCKNCHRGGVSYTDLGNVKTNICLRCHRDSPQSWFINDGTMATPSGLFAETDASNARGSYPAGLLPGEETSHMWAAPDVNAAAGAAAPVNRRFYGRYGITAGKVACSRCHDPHGDEESNPQLLKLGGGAAEAMCLDCHRPWDQSDNHGWETHPLVADYAAKAAASSGRLLAAPGNGGGSGDIRLVNGGVSCTSCHGVHFVDSDASTVDGKGRPLSPGSGRLLRADGPQRTNKSALCQACHTYLEHGDASGEKAGCLVCHGGHAYDPTAPNGFVLRKIAATATFGEVSGLVYSSPEVLNAALKYTFWNDRTDGTADGYCEKCHGDAGTIGAGAGQYHVRTAVCTDCHVHNRPGNAYSFEPNCGACHAFPPAWGSHQAHLADGRLLAPLACGTCHKASGHRNDLSEVRFDPADPRLAGASYSDQGGDETSRYTPAGGYSAEPAYGSCGSLYCHSNAAPFDGLNVFRNPLWGGEAQSCASCHGSGGRTTSLSGRHGGHTDATTYGFACPKCHADTVTAEAAIGDNSRHVNQVKDVSFASGGAYDAGTRACTTTYCHSDGRGGLPGQAVKWSDAGPLSCASCHNGRIGDASQMQSNAHLRLANEVWIRQYPCASCHYETVDGVGDLKSFSRHVNGAKDIAFDSKWSILGKPAPTYNAANLVCENIYCHSDGTTVNPEIRDFPWNLDQHADCDTCHGHDRSDDCSRCHTGAVPSWSPEDQWKRAMPMYANTGPGTERANSHLRHLETEFSCENCHATTVVGACGDCHGATVPAGVMTEVGHVNAAVHVNKIKDVVFKDGGSYDPVHKRCTNTACHTGNDPVWGDSVQSEILCLTCHGTTEADVDDFNAFNDTQGRINMNEWFSAGHGRKTADGPYPSGNAAANFPGNPCWYCHDNQILHKDAENPFRLKMHPQFEARFEKECVYCHMERTDSECLGCHNAVESLSPQLPAIVPPTFTTDHSGYTDGGTSCLTAGCHLPMDETQCLSCHDNPGNSAPQLVAGKVYVGSPDPPYSLDHATYADGLTSCLTSGCHTADAHIHNTGAGVWNSALKTDVKNQYLMMGVCLQCHDNDDNGRCNACHTGSQYVLGYDPGTGFKSGASKASSTHFGFKHFADYQNNGVWRGGKFCWDCHDPHGDTNIYMIQNKVATETDGAFGVPLKREAVTFTKKQSGLDYAKNSPPYNGICNVCHQETGQHYRFDYGDGHQSGRVCTTCHNHGFGDSHASGRSCTECHQNKPISTHTGFSQPRDCTKCHEGAILKRLDIMRQFRGQSHHVQGVEVNNRHCYSCHWEATEEGLINLDYHEGYNYKTHSGTSNAKSDLVIWGPGERPARYELGTTAQTFVAQKIGTAEERAEVAKVNDHCIGCHSDQNNNTESFGDCKTPRQYAWDRSSIAARYLQTGTTVWGKYPAASLSARKVQTKAFSAHGNAVANEGGWSTATGEDETLPNTRGGSRNVQCYDCHSSHGSYTSGVTSSYRTFDNNFGGGNLKETQAGKGGYGVTYKAKGISGGVNPMNPGAAQCFDCHETADGAAAGRPWGYQSTYGATAPIIGYRDSSRFGGGSTGHKSRFGYRSGMNSLGGHLKASAPLSQPADGAINGLCSPCHDPHGVSSSLGDDLSYGVPLLKGTWLTSPYKDDKPQRAEDINAVSYVYIDRKIFGNASTRIAEDESRFAGLCLRCHPKEKLTDGINKNTSFRSPDRIHETVKGWGNNQEHSYPCAKCHSPHASGLGRLMRTNCLNPSHRGEVTAGGSPTYGDEGRYPNLDGYTWPSCHESMTGSWNNQQWNDVTPW